MHCYPSRNEVRETKLYIAAEKGKFSLDYVLYSSEMKKLEKDGFHISNVKPFSNEGLYSVTIDWYRAFEDNVPYAIPHIVFAYTHGIVETFPKASVKNFAQELYVIAKRTYFKK